MAFHDTNEHFSILKTNKQYYYQKDNSLLQKIEIPDVFQQQLNDSRQVYILPIKRKDSDGQESIKEYGMAINQNDICFWQLDLNEEDLFWSKVTYLYRLNFAKKIESKEHLVIQQAIFNIKKDGFYIVYQENDICKIYQWSPIPTIYESQYGFEAPLVISRLPKVNNAQYIPQSTSKK
jgi:hypothetical protein